MPTNNLKKETDSLSSRDRRKLIRESVLLSTGGLKKKVDVDLPQFETLVEADDFD